MFKHHTLAFSAYGKRNIWLRETFFLLNKSIKSFLYFQILYAGIFLWLLLILSLVISFLLIRAVIVQARELIWFFILSLFSFVIVSACSVLSWFVERLSTWRVAHWVSPSFMSLPYVYFMYDFLTLLFMENSRLLYLIDLFEPILLNFVGMVASTCLLYLLLSSLFYLHFELCSNNLDLSALVWSLHVDLLDADAMVICWGRLW